MLLPIQKEVLQFFMVELRFFCLVKAMSKLIFNTSSAAFLAIKKVSFALPVWKGL